MGGFMTGFGQGIAQSNAIPNAIGKLAMMPYLMAMQERRGQNDAAVAQLRQMQAQKIQQEMADAQAMRDGVAMMAEKMGIDPRMAAGRSLSDLREIQMMDAANLANAEGLSEQQRAQNQAVFRSILDRAAAVANAVKGGASYQYQKNGAAFSPYFGTAQVADQAVRNAYLAKEQADIRHKNALTARAGRTGGGGGGSRDTSAGWRTGTDENGKTVFYNPRTQSVVDSPVQLQSKSSGGRSTRSGRSTQAVNPMLEQARQAIKNGAAFDKVANRYKELTGEDFTE